MTQPKSIGTIHSFPYYPRVYMAQIAAKYAGVELDIPADFEFGVTNRTPEYLAKFPYGKAPAMETTEGPLYESEAIAYYVAISNPDAKLLGSTNYEKARVLQFQFLSAGTFGSNLGKWYFPLKGWAAYNESEVIKAKNDLHAALATFDKEVKGKTYLVGEGVTLADISVAATLFTGFTQLFDEEYRSAFPNVTRWFEHAISLPEFKSVVGEYSLCVTPLVHA
eukprot:Partr_v1_DN24295_c0_g1_i1_m36562 putative Elongation factor